MVVEITRKAAIYGLLALLLVGSASWLAVSAVQRHNAEQAALAQRLSAERAALAALKKTVAQASSATESLISIESEKNDQTFKEYFDQSDQYLKDQRQRVLDVDTSLSERAVVRSAKAYLEGLTDLVRLSTLRYRKNLAVSSASDSLQRATHDYAMSPYNEYTIGYEQRRMNDARDEATKALAELTSANRDYIGSIKAFRTSSAGWLKSLSGFRLLDDRFLQRIERESNAK